MRRIFNNILDFITGFDLNHELQRVLEMDNWNRDAIRRYQLEKFEILKRYAEKSEIYKNCRSWNLEDFPKYDRKFFRLNRDKFSTNFRKSYMIEYTSGSTGNPKKVVVSKEMILAKRVSHLKMLKWFNLKREDSELFIGGLKKNLVTSIYYFLKNKTFLPSNNITTKMARAYLDIINRKKPKIIFSYPYVLFIILNYAEHKGIKMHQPDLVYTGANKLYPEVEDLIRICFPESRIVNEYWSTESNIGVTCPEGNMHIDEDTAIIELDNIDENGFGDLLLTNLYSYDQPLIRYDLGDRIKLSDKQCPCGRKTRIIEDIAGRTNDYYCLKDGKIVFYMDMRIDNFADNILIYQVVHHKSDDSFLLKYVALDKSKPLDEKAIRKNFRYTCGADLSIERVDDIAFGDSGKFQVFISV
ncbi:MAG: AMP-binding protein [Bacteroidales bacterium]|nr:AMP-binding protein [Bacteroidales bacterium]